MPTAPLQFTHIAVFDCKVEALSTLMNTATGMERWVPNCRSVRFEHPAGVLAVGSVRYVTLKTGLVAAEAITFLDAPTKLNYTIVTMGGIKLGGFLKNYEGTTLLEPLANGRCRLTWSVHFECIGAMKLISPVLRMSISALIGLMVSNICHEAGGRRVS